MPVGEIAARTQCKRTAVHGYKLDRNAKTACPPPQSDWQIASSGRQIQYSYRLGVVARECAGMKQRIPD